MTEEEVREEIRGRLKVAMIGFALLALGFISGLDFLTVAGIVCLIVYIIKRFTGVSPYYFPKE